MRAFLEYARDVVLVVIILALIGGWLVSYWLVVGIAYLLAAIASLFWKKTPNAPAPQRRPARHP